MLALNGADQLNGPRQWGSLLFCLVIVLSLQRAEGSTEETGSSYTKIRILPPAPNTRRIAALRPSCASEITSFTPRSPRRARLLRKVDQKVSASDGPMCSPTISRRPSLLAATAIIIAAAL